ncbi:MAG: cytochrome c maturation protein CcmE [Fimbriimonadales bacterium]|nr:cytochrome c maturation protein CcmE [Fimbriimonadales bacterium]
MKSGALLAILAILAGIGLSVYSFIQAGIPYVSARVALQQPGTRVHVAGRIEHSSAKYDALKGVLEFTLIDQEGTRLPVRYKGSKPANFDQAPTCSIAGTVKEGVFEATDIKTQCPSKYESIRSL